MSFTYPTLFLRRGQMYPNFYPPEYCHEDYPVAFEGDVSVERLFSAYKQGIYPMIEDEIMMWFSPDPRTVLYLDDFKVSRSLRQSVRNRNYEVTLNRDFETVVRTCATITRVMFGIFESNATWIDEELTQSYVELFRLGNAHSIEVWHDDELVGGLFGVCIGKLFTGESMFHKKRDASKVALYRLVQHLRQSEFKLIDCQVSTELLMSLGAQNISRRKYLAHARAAVHEQQPRNMWNQLNA